ncbi:hypothetical protein PG993_012549 [Apiospora rasikravindrae]|uniref:Uncharacterized protein n=1 Tax=Apiospora rasikravindrae TaxID=990691 RepID=A0ABR1S2V9_9PEZI
MTEKRKPPRRWLAHEDDILRLAASKYDSSFIDWQEVSTHLEGRSNKDCRRRWVYALKIPVTKGPWVQEEDQRLEAAVEMHGHRRWHECLNPAINRSRWSLLEDSTLECAVRIYGRNWTEIVERFFYDRTPIAARNRHLRAELTGPFEMEAQYPSRGMMAPSHLSHWVSMPPPIPPGNLAAGNSLDSIHNSGLHSGLPPLEYRPAFPQTDLRSGVSYAGPAMPISGNPSAHNVLDPAASLPSRMSPLELEAAFRELCTPPSSGHIGVGNYMTCSGAEYDSPPSSASTSGLTTLVCAPLVSPLTTGAPTPEWVQPESSQSLDDMIWQMASYRVQAWGNSGR